MFCGKSGDGLINKTHCRALRAVHQNFELSLSELLIQDKSDRVHVRNLRCLMTEVCVNKANPEFM